MKNFVVYDQHGNILRTGSCPDHDLKLQGENTMEGTADDATQKIVDGKVVDKTPEEIERDNPTIPEVPEDDQQAFITKKQWQKVTDKLAELGGQK